MTTEMIENASGITIKHDGRTTFTTDGRLVNFLPTESVYTFNASFPDAVKAKAGFWYWSIQWSPPGAPSAYGWHSLGMAGVAAAKQKWTNIIVLGDAPPGANLFLGRARLTRTVSPNTTWMGQTVTPPDFAGRWIPVAGSMLLEQAVGFARAISIYVANGTPGREGPVGKLVAYLDHTVSGNCGGYRAWGDPVYTTGRGGENAWFGGGASGQLIWTPSALGPSKKQSSGVASGSIFLTQPDRHKWNGSDPPVYDDPSNYASTYSIELAGRFGRAPE